MKNEYDLSTMKSRPNPYAKQLKKQVTMRLEEEVIDYFKEMAKGVRNTLSKPYKFVFKRLCGFT